jgi:hypothetical protein
MRNISGTPSQFRSSPVPKSKTKETPATLIVVASGLFFVVAIVVFYFLASYLTGGFSDSPLFNADRDKFTPLGNIVSVAIIAILFVLYYAPTILP